MPWYKVASYYLCHLSIYHLMSALALNFTVDKSNHFTGFQSRNGVKISSAPCLGRSRLAEGILFLLLWPGTFTFSPTCTVTDFLLSLHSWLLCCLKIFVMIEKILVLKQNNIW